MANNNGYQTGLVNIVGVNNMGGSRSGVVSNNIALPNNQPPSVSPLPVPSSDAPPDITQGKFQQIQQDTQRQYEGVRSAIEQQGRIRRAAMEARGQPGRHGVIAEIFDSIAGAGLTYLQTKAQEQEAADAERVAQAELTARMQLEEVFNNAHGRFREYGHEHGINTTRADVQRILSDVIAEGSLPADVVQSLVQFAGTETRQLETAVTTRYLETSRELSQAQISAVEAAVTYQVSDLVGKATNPQLSQAQRDANWNQINDAIIRGTEGLDQTQRLTILGNILDSVSESSTLTAAQRADIEQRRFDMEWFYPFVENVIRPQTQGNPAAFAYALRTFAPESLQGVLGDIPTTTELWRDAASEIGAIESIQEYYRKRFQEQNQNAGINPQATKAALEVAYRIFNRTDANAIAELDRIKRKPEADRLPHETLALTFVEAWETDRDEYNSLFQRRQELYQEQAGQVIRFAEGAQPQTETWTDVNGNVYRKFVIDEHTREHVYVNEQLSPAAREAMQLQVQSVGQQIAQIDSQINQIIEDAASSGINLTNTNDRTYINLIMEDLDRQSYTPDTESARAFANASGSPALPGNTGQEESPLWYMQQGRNQPPGFNWGSGSPPPGYESGTPPLFNFALNTIEGQAVPIPFANHRSDITVSSDYGDRVHPVHGGTRFHAGLDFSGPSVNTEDVGAVSIGGGHVIDAYNWGGYGGTVLVQTPTGHIEQYSHLRSFFVKPGDSIAPGTPVGVIGGGSGDPMAGTSTGRHLHFQVWQPGTRSYDSPDQNTLDPLVYLSSLGQYEAVPRGLGQPQSSQHLSYGMPTPSATPMGNGNYLATIREQYPYLAAFLQNFSIQVPAEQVYQGSDPIDTPHAPTNREAYTFPNNPNANYGYETIKNDPEWARSIARVADYIGIPGQWLADLMWFESSHDVTAIGPATHLGHGVGLIQAMSAGVLYDWGYGIAETQAMSRAEYMDKIAKRFLEPWKGRINSIHDLVSVIFTGDLGSSGSSSDGWSTLDNYVSQLGVAVGRSYRNSPMATALQSTHETYQAGCATCAQMVNRFGDIVPHSPPG